MRAEKQLLLDEFQEKIGQANALVLTSYKKLEPNKAAGFRNDLRKQGSGMGIIRKRILAKAAKENGFELDLDALHGHIAVIFIGGDPVETTKSIFQFAKENDEVLTVLGGRFDGQLRTAADVEAISKLPSRDELRAQFLGLLEAPMSQTLASIEALLTSVLYCLENKSQEAADESQEAAETT
jgi:large subunit ribosomal protein L10